MKRAVRAVVAVAAIGSAMALAACSTPTPEPTVTTEADGVGDTVIVFAAASLTESFGKIETAFEAANPDVDVVLNFGGSSGLATQIVEGAPADVFAAASPTTMATVVDAGLADPATDFATNVLQLVVPAGNPGGVTSPADLANPDLAVAICAVEVPCGAAAAKALEAAGVIASVDTYEQDVKAVLTKVELGEVDAGLVYATDVQAAGDTVEGVELPDAPVVAYPIATLLASENSEAAAAFVAWVLSPEGQAVLAAAGFGVP